MVIHMTSIVGIICFALFLKRYKITIINQGNSFRKDNSFNSELLLVVFFVILFFLFGLRDGGGADDSTYQVFYENGYGSDSFIGILTHKEPFFILISNVCKFLGLNYKGLFLAYAAFTMLLFYKAAKKYVNSVDCALLFVLSFFFFLYTPIFTVMRQAAAMAAIFYYYTIDRKDTKRKILFGIVSIFFHYGSVVVFLFDWIYHRFLEKKQYGVIFRLLVPITALAINYLVDFRGIIQYIANLVSIYSYMNDDNNFLVNSNIDIVTIGAFLIYCFVVWRECGLSKKLDGYNKIILDMQLVYFTITFLTSYLRWGSRIKFYYMSFIVFLLYQAIQNIYNKKILYGITIIGLFCAIAYIFSTVDGIYNYVWSLHFID